MGDSQWIGIYGRFNRIGNVNRVLSIVGWGDAGEQKNYKTNSVFDGSQRA